MDKISSAIAAIICFAAAAGSIFAYHQIDVLAMHDLAYPSCKEFSGYCNYNYFLATAVSFATFAISSVSFMFAFRELTTKKPQRRSFR